MQLKCLLQHIFKTLATNMANCIIKIMGTDIFMELSSNKPL